MNPKGALNVIRKVAPAAATVLGGPLAGTAAAVIAGKLGTDPTPAAIARAVQADPSLAAKLAELDTDLARAAMIDTQHARETVGGSRWGFAIDASVFLLVAALIYSLVFRDIAESNQRAFDIVLGAVLGSYGAVVTYWRGSSRGSAEKQAQLDRR